MFVIGSSFVNGTKIALLSRGRSVANLSVRVGASLPNDATVLATKVNINSRTAEDLKVTGNPQPPVAQRPKKYRVPGFGTILCTAPSTGEYLRPPIASASGSNTGILFVRYTTVLQIIPVTF